MPLSNHALRAIIARRQYGPRKTAQAPLAARQAFGTRKPLMRSHTAPNRIRSFGATEVTRLISETHIVHRGCAGTTEAGNVAPNFDQIFGPGSFTKVRPHGRPFVDLSGKTHADPSNSYILVIPNDVIDALS